MTLPTRASRKRAGDNAAATPQKKAKTEASDAQRRTRRQTTEQSTESTPKATKATKEVAKGKAKATKATKAVATPKAAKTAKGAKETGSSPATIVQRKPTLFDDLDSALIKPDSDHRRQLLGIDDDGDDDDDDDDDDSDSSSSLSSMEDVDFEDVPLAPEEKGKGKEVDNRASEEGEEDSDSDEDAEFEDVPSAGPASFSLATMAALGHGDEAGGSSSNPGDLELTLRKDTRVSLTNPFGTKKGPSKMERLVRTATHCVHVQTLLWHNAVRNAWLCDAEVQGLVLSHLPPRIYDEVERWYREGGGSYKQYTKAEVKKQAKEEAKSEAKKKVKKEAEKEAKRKTTKVAEKEAKKTTRKVAEKEAKKTATKTNSGDNDKGKPQYVPWTQPHPNESEEIKKLRRDWDKRALETEYDQLQYNRHYDVYVRNGTWKLEGPDHLLSEEKRLDAHKGRNVRKLPHGGTADLTFGDPLFRLLRVLGAWWWRTFRVTAPGLRKRGYLSLERLDRFLAAAKATAGRGDTARFGEQIPSLAAFRRHAATLTGSRDVGAQLFTALLRALGLEARMVASLQPLGFGWNKLEDADAEEEKKEEREAKEKKDEKKEKKEEKPSRTAPRKAKQDVVVIQDSDDDSLSLEEINSDNEAVVVLPPVTTPTKKGARQGLDGSAQGSGFDEDLAYPHYWTEVLSPATNKWMPVDALVKRVVAQSRELVETLEPRGAKAERARQVMAYVVGYAADGTAKDVTVRYLKRRVLPGRTKGVRLPPEKVAVYDRGGKRVVRHETVDWFAQAAMRGYVRGTRDSHPLTDVDAEEDRTELQPAKAEARAVEPGEETLQSYKQSTEYVLERHLKREEALVRGAKPVKTFHAKKKKTGGAGEGTGSGERVFRRKDVVAVKSAETWHKQGRAPVPGARPLKRVPYRAATLNRRREIAEAEAATGAPVLQGLYSEAQTDWIIPEPIRDGVIPKNAYGNIDLFAEHMLPQGAAHVPFRGAARVCRKLGVDFAEAVVDFEFGHRMAVPVVQGVVVAAEQHDRVMAELARDEAERTRKADEKRRATALRLWRKMLMGLRIVQRIRQDHGEVREDERVFGPRGHHTVDLGETGTKQTAKEDESSRFFQEEGEEEEDKDKTTSSFFPVEEEDDEADDDVTAMGGGFIVEDGRVT